MIANASYQYQRMLITHQKKKKNQIKKKRKLEMISAMPSAVWRWNCSFDL